MILALLRSERLQLIGSVFLAVPASGTSALVASSDGDQAGMAFIVATVAGAAVVAVLAAVERLLMWR